MQCPKVLLSMKQMVLIFKVENFQLHPVFNQENSSKKPEKY